MKCRLGDIVEIIMGQSPKSEYYNTEGIGTPFLQGNKYFGDKYPEVETYTTKVTKLAKANDVIMSVRAPVGDLNMAKEDLCLGRGVCAIRMKNGEQEFLYYLMKFYAKHLINQETGTVFGSVNKQDISSLVVDIPDDINEQRRIANKLKCIDDKIEINKRINNNFAA